MGRLYFPHHAGTTRTMARQTAGAGDMVRMDVRVDDKMQPETTLAKQRIVRFRIARRVNDGRLARFAPR